MDEKILDLIEKMYAEMKQGFKQVNEEMQNGFKEVNEKIYAIEKQQNLIYEEVARTREDMTEARADLRLVKIATVENSKDIEKLKLIK